MPDLTANTHTELFLKAIAEGSTTPEGLVPENHLELWLQQIMEMGGVSGNYVRYTEQELSAAEEAQARDNIGAAGMEDLAPAYDSTIPYKVGNLLTYLGKQYEVTGDDGVAPPVGTLPTDTNYFTERPVSEIIEMIKNGSIQVGSAKEAESLKTSVGVTDSTPFSAETAGGDSDISTGYQNLNKLVGCKVVTAQLIPNNKTSVSHTVAQDVETSGYASTSTQINVSGLISGQKYAVYSVSSSDKLYYRNAQNGNSFKTPSVFTLTSGFFQPSGDVPFRLYYDAGLTAGTYTVTLFLFPLTLRYGSNDVVNAIIGNTSDVYERFSNLISFDPNILKDTDYDTGSFSMCKSASLESVEYNQWDEEWEQGAFDTTTGVNTSSTTQIRSKNLIRVKGGQTYSNVGTTIWCMFYDANMNIIQLPNESYTSANVMKISTPRQIPTNAYWMKFYTISNYGGSYKGDISVFLYWDGSRIGYEPYKKHIYPMPNKDLNGILKVVDGKVVADGDELTPDGSGNAQRWKKKKISDYGWTKETDGDIAYFKCTINDIFIPSDYASRVVDVQTTKYMPSINVSYGLMSDKSWLHIGRNFSVRDDTYSTAEAFVEANANVEFQYKLDTPTTLTADTFSRNVYMDDFGFISFLDENGNVIDGLQGNEILYKANVGGFAESLYVRADGDPEFFAEAEDLTDEALQARGYYKLQVLLSPLTDAAGLTYDIEEAMKIGNLVSLTIRATNLEETSISSGDPLFTLASDLIPAGTIKAYANVAGSVVSCTISNLGSVSVDAAIAQNETVSIILTYAV